MKIGNKEILKRGKPFFIADIAANQMLQNFKILMQKQ